MKERVFFEEFESLYYFHGSTQNWAMQGFHFHNQYEIILFLNDGALLEIGDRVYHVMKGDLFFINNREYHIIHYCLNLLFCGIPSVLYRSRHISSRIKSVDRTKWYQDK